MTRWLKSRVLEAPDTVRGDGSVRAESLGHTHQATHLRNSVSRRVLMETFEPRLLLSADLFPIAGTLSAPGEEDSYNITFAEPARISFDSLTPSELNWRLQGPGGVDVTGALDRVDTNARQTPAVFDVARGTYTFSVFGAASQTGDYEFNINDLSDDPVLAL